MEMLLHSAHEVLRRGSGIGAMNTTNSTTNNTVLTVQQGYDLFRVVGRNPDIVEEVLRFECAPRDPPSQLDRSIVPNELLVLTYKAPLRYDRAENYTNVKTLRNWLQMENTVVLPGTSQYSQDWCVGTPCSPYDTCVIVWRYIWDTFGDFGQLGIPTFSNPSREWRCMFYLSSRPGVRGKSCSSDRYALNSTLWIGNDVDSQLSTSLEGGADNIVFWTGRLPNETFSEIIGRQFLNQRGLKCTLRAPCQPAMDCTKIGSWTTIAMGTQNAVYQLPWTFLVVSSLKNMNQQLWNQYHELEDALESLALDTFNIDEFSPKNWNSEGLLDELAGLGGFFAALGGFIPAIGPAVSTVGIVASSAGAFISNSLSQRTILKAQKTFAGIVSALYKQLLAGFNDVFEMLFNGESIGTSNHSFNITDMIRNGSWANPNVVANVSDLNAKVIEVLSRSINVLWNTPTSNKRWVLFVTLDDSSKCETDSSGPEDSRYCADGGVYYTYNFIEHRAEGGGVSYPWGGDKLGPILDIELSWVTKASARSYQAMKSVGGNPFKFDQLEGTRFFINQTLSQHNNTIDLVQSAGQYAGSWTLPVCNASYWEDRGIVIMPKIQRFESQLLLILHVYVNADLSLGDPEETFEWAKAAGMQGFETFWHRCTRTMENKNFVWPSGVTEVKYPANGNDEPYVVRKPHS